MKKLVAVSLFALCSACTSTGDVSQKPDANNTYKQHPGRTLPLEEKAFVLAIEELNKDAIIKELGKPAKADDVKIKGTSKIVASIWHYHHINTDVEGKYYATTELDFVEGKVKQVVFLNNDGSEKELDKDQKSYEIPEKNSTN